MYYCDNNASIPTIANLPLQTTFCLLVEKFDGVSQTCTFNPAFSGAGASVFMRRYYGGTWTTWTQQAYILSGTETPSDTIGLNGNIYIKYS